MRVQRPAGSQNVGTIHVVGADVVPLLEGHADTRERFSWNPFTYSDKRSFCGGEKLPTCEILFKGGPKLEAELQEYVRSKGWSSWMTIQTSESGSYDEQHILAFLEEHLEKASPDRPWRFLLVDDFGPHKTDAVRRLAWSRKYIVVVHGGGATSIAQTNDTDQNQHVRRLYTELESMELLRQSSTLEKKIPVLSHKRTIDLFARIWQEDAIHDQARAGYTMTGTTLPLDGDDDLVRREAKTFWEEREMRWKRPKILQDVEDAHKAGDLAWCYEHVYDKLVKKYPKRGQMDDTLAGQFDACWDDDDIPWTDDERGHGDGSDDNASDTGDDDDDSHGDGDHPGDEVLSVHGDSDAEVAAGDHGSLGGGGPLVAVVPEAEAELAEAHHNKMVKLKLRREEAVELGNAGIVLAYDKALHSADKQFRIIRQESPAVVTAMRHRQAMEKAELAKRRDEVAQLNEGKRKLADVEKARQATMEKVKDIKSEMKKVRRDLAESIAVKTFSVEDLGKGKTSKQDVKKATKARMSVLDRLSHLGAGLSAEQANDFEWFKENWDTVNGDQLGAAWPEKFAEMTQKACDDIAAGINNAFSQLVNAETARCLSGIPRLRL